MFYPLRKLIHRALNSLYSARLDPACTITNDIVATVKELKKQDGKDIWLWGSLTIMKELFDAGLIDEVDLRICPSTRGKGKHLFHDTQELKLLKATSFDNGLVYIRYEVQHNK